MAPQIDQRCARSVRAAIKIDLLVPECRAHIVEIVHCDVGRVEREISFGFKLFATLTNGFNREEGAEETLRIRGIEEFAIQRVRLAGTALVHEDQIAMFAHASEHLSNAGRIFGGGGTWTTSEIEQRVALTLLPG